MYFDEIGWCTSHEIGQRIDLVVEGLSGQLAVECDGDFWHGPDKYEEDMARQRDLERCGWTFWRMRESTFRLNPDGALDSLWETLEKLKITANSIKEKTVVSPEKNDMNGTQAKNEEQTLTLVVTTMTEEDQTTIVTNVNAELEVEDSHGEKSELSINAMHEAVVERAKLIEEETWFLISKHESFNSFQKKLSYTMGTIAKYKGNPSVKQGYWGLDILFVALERGILKREQLDGMISVQTTQDLLKKCSADFRKAK